MQRYDEETVVVKYGGHAMGDEAARAQLRARHRAAGADRHQPDRGARRRPADRRDAQARSASSRSSPTACASPTRRPWRSSRWCWPARSTSRSSATSTRAGGKAIGLCGKDGNMVLAAQGRRAPCVDPGFQHREGGRPRLRRRARQGRPHGARPDARPRADPGAGAGRAAARRRHLQRQRRHLCRRHRRRAQGQAPPAAHRRAGRARQVRRS